MRLNNGWATFWNRQTTALHSAEEPSYYNSLASELGMLFAGRTFSSILEVGCGSGVLYAPLGFDRAKKYKGVDLSHSMLQIFREKYPNVLLVYGSAEAYIDDQKYDLIFSNAVVQYMDPTVLKSFIRNAAAMLAEKGMIILGMVPWAPLKFAYHCGDIARGTMPRWTLVKSFIRARIRDDMGYWYKWEDLRRLAALHELDPFFFGSLTNPYRFHVVLTRINEYHGQDMEVISPLVAWRRP